MIAPPPAPQLGYVFINADLMQRMSFVDFLCDTFEIIQTLTTEGDAQDGMVRLEMRSALFKCGYTQYTFKVTRLSDNRYIIGDVVPHYAS